VVDHSKEINKTILAMKNLFIIAFIFFPPPESVILLSVFVCLSSLCRSDAKKKEKLKIMLY
jgi:hypothetical protein